MNDKISAEEREKLYNEIWTEAMSKVAPRYGVSDVWLRKKCSLWDIPIPSREYRGRVAHGQNPRRTPLPELSNEAKRFVYGYAVTYIDVIALQDAALYCEDPLYVYSDMTKGKIESARKTLEVPTSLKYLTDSQREKLKELEKDRKCKSTVPYRRLFSVISSICRCVKDLEGYGRMGVDEAEVFAAKTYWNVEYLMTTENGKTSIGLKFVEWHWSSERQKKEFSYSDTDKQSLEDQAGEIVYRLFVEGGKIILLEELERRRELKRRAEAEWKRKLEPYVKEENRKVQQALEDATAYRNAQLIRDYADAYYHKNSSVFPEKPELLQYYEWLHKRADWLDPLLENDYNALLEGKS